MPTSLTDEAVARGPVRGALADTAASLREVFGNRGLRRIQYALAGSLIGDWAYATAVTVWAYGVGGAKAVGLWGAIRFVLMAVTSPLAAAVADKYSRKVVMITSDVARGALVVAAAACIAADTAPAPVFVLATLTSMLGCVFRPAQAAFLPSLADRPEQLTAANGVSSTLESLAMFIGPALGASLIAVTEVQNVFLINAASFLLSAVLVASIAGRPSVADEDEDDEPHESGLSAMFAGFREIRRSRDLQIVAFLVSAQTLIAGAGTVFTVLMAVDILDIGARGVGYVDAVFGVGAIVGGVVAIARAPRARLTGDLAIGVVLWSLPLLLVAAWPSAVSVFVLGLVLGFGNPLVDVNFYTVVQRVTPDRVLGRVFGALEGALIATMALGSALMPVLDDTIGLRGTLVVLGLVVGLPALATFPAARALDRRLHTPDDLPLLHSLPVFAPLGPARLEALAHHVVRTQVPAGTSIVTEGELGHTFYVIESGQVAVTHGDSLVRHEGPGEYFGEIALLRDIPRTATVTATEDTVLLELARGPFLDAVAGEADTVTAFDDVVSYRLRF